MAHKIIELTLGDYASSGQLLFNKHLEASALACFRKAESLADRTSPEAPKVLYLLGHCLWQMKQFAEAESVLLEAIALDASYPEPYHILANLYTNLGNFELAEKNFKESLLLLEKSGRYSKDVVVDYALFHLYTGDYRTGFDLFEARRDHFRAAYIDSIPQWDGISDISDQTLYVYSEQGIGDIIQFSRYLPLLAEKCGKLIFGTPPELLPLFRAFPKSIIGELIPRLLENAPPVADFCLPIVSAAKFFDVPPDPTYIQQMARAHPFDLVTPMDDGTMRIGLCWSGNPTHSRDRERSVALETLMPLAALDGIQLYSFQVGNRAVEVEMIGATPFVYQLQDELTDWSKTASALLEMDLVISVDTALAHLAGTLGVSVWLMIPTECDWRWGHSGEKTHWYPMMRLFRQETAGNWKGVVARMIDELGAA